MGLFVLAPSRNCSTVLSVGHRPLPRLLHGGVDAHVLFADQNEAARCFACAKKSLVGLPSGDFIIAEGVAGKKDAALAAWDHLLVGTLDYQMDTVAQLTR